MQWCHLKQIQTEQGGTVFSIPSDSNGQSELIAGPNMKAADL